MEYFFYNTDARALFDLPLPRFRVLIDKGFAAVGGDKQKYGEQLAQLSKGDIILMYNNGVGIVAIGRVKEGWDGVSHEDYSYYTVREMELTDGRHEYRISIDWFLDLSSSPIGLGEIRERLGSTPRRAVRRIVKQRSEVALLIEELWAARPSIAEELDENYSYPEGASRTILVNSYERNPEARRKCIAHYKAKCYICGFSFGAVYGSEAEGFIHVHHLKPLSGVGREYLVNPVEDLRPVCPNCHAVLHLGGRCRTLEEVREMLELQRAPNTGPEADG